MQGVICPATRTLLQY